MKCLLCLFLVFVLLLTLGLIAGCGSRPAPKQETSKNQEHLPTIPDVEEEQKPALKDCVGYDFANIPRYPNCQRTKFYNYDYRVGPSSSIMITYSTTDSVQKIADFYLQSSLPQSGWQIRENSSSDFDLSCPDSKGSTDGIRTGDFSISNRYEIWINCPANSSWGQLKSSDPTLDPKNYNSKPSSDAIEIINNTNEVVGQDIPGTRPDSAYTKRIEYSAKPKGYAPGNETTVKYVCAQSVGQLAAEYVSKGYILSNAEGSEGTLQATTSFPSISLNPYNDFDDLSNVTIENQ
jgi:hypothetical protein